MSSVANQPNPCGLSGADYTSALFDLLPRGAIWPRFQNTTLYKIVAGLGDFFMRFQNRACVLLEQESFPGTAVEMLPDWETALGLPDPCTAGLAMTVTQRQAACVARLAGSFNPTAANLIAYAATFGLVITITYPAANTIVIHGYPVSVTYFRAGQSFAGDLLSTFTPNALLECIMAPVIPAHVAYSFAFDL
jgi:uncharacterized protein YmfQ (DUF2313 family)